jgi:WD40 repeat protein
VEGQTGSALVWDVTTNKSTLLKGHSERVATIQFDRSGKRIVTASWDGTTRIWDQSSGKELIRLVQPKGRTFTAGFSADGEWIATSLNGNILRLWRVPKTTEPDQIVIMEPSSSILLSDKNNLTQIKFAPKGDIFAAAFENGDIHLWHMPDHTLRAILEGDRSGIRSMYFQPDGEQITAMTSKGRLLSWHILPALSLADDLLLPPGT